MNKKVYFTLVGASVAILLAILPTSSSSQESKEVIKLTEDNTVVLSEEVSDSAVAEVISKVQDLNHGYRSTQGPIYLFLRTPGGSIQAGLELIEALSASKRKIHTITAFAASMGFQIVQNMGDRLILNSGVLMSHRAAGGFQGTFGGRSPSQIDNRYALWLSRLNDLDKQTVSRTKGKQTLESYQAAYADEMWLTGVQSVEKGYADRVVKARCDGTLDGKVEHQVNFMGFVISYQTFRCPMNSGMVDVKIGNMDGTVFIGSKSEEITEAFTYEYNKKLQSPKPMVLQ